MNIKSDTESKLCLETAQIRQSCSLPHAGLIFEVIKNMPGWGPVRVGAHMGPYGPIWALMGPPGQVLEDYVNFP